jgi:cytosine/uracil/thiamine/allantoin permease
MKKGFGKNSLIAFILFVCLLYPVGLRADFQGRDAAMLAVGVVDVTLIGLMIWKAVTPKKPKPAVAPIPAPEPTVPTLSFESSPDVAPVINR